MVILVPPDAPMTKRTRPVDSLTITVGTIDERGLLPGTIKLADINAKIKKKYDIGFVIINVVIINTRTWGDSKTVCNIGRTKIVHFIIENNAGLFRCEFCSKTNRNAVRIHKMVIKVCYHMVGYYRLIVEVMETPIPSPSNTLT